MRSPEPAPSDSSRSLEARSAAAVAGAGAALVAGALLFGAVPLFVAGLAFIALAALAPAWLELAGRPVRVRRRLAATRVLEDESLEAVVEVWRGALGLPGAELRDPLAGRPLALDEPMSLQPGRRRVALRVVTRIHRRGWHSFPAPEIVLSDALGLARLRRGGGSAPSEVLVLPRTEPVRWRGRAPRRAASGETAHSSHEPIGAGDVDGLRQYMPGTPASRIHWPALARGAGLLERRLVSESELAPLVVLDARTGDGPGGEHRLDAAVRAAASLTLMLAREGRCHVLIPGETVPAELDRSLSGWPSVHTRLALVEEERDPSAAPRLRPGVPVGSLLYVAAAAPSPAPWASWRSRLGAVILVLPNSVLRPREAVVGFEVSGCVGCVLGVAAGRRRAA